AGPQPLGDVDQYVVTDVMSPGVVDDLESVEVDEHHRARGWGAGEVLQNGIEMGPVGQAREVVALGSSAERLLGMPTSGDVLDLGQQVTGAVLTTQTGQRDRGDAHAPGLVDQPHLE